MFGSGVARMDDSSKQNLARMLDSIRFELLPLGGAIDQSAYLPEGCEVAVTSDPERGIEPTIRLSVALAERGFEVIPHLSAQMTPDRASLESQMDQLLAAGIDRALVVGGVSDSPGEYFDAASLLDAIDDLGNPFREIGIGGYPEGHHVIARDSIDCALLAKAPRSQWITTQICFDTSRLRSWTERLRAEGVGVPIWIGIPGVADLSGLVSLGLRMRAGRSLQFMFEHPRLVARLLRPGGRAANALVADLATLSGDEVLGIEGFHLFTYNQVRAAEKWRRSLLRRLGG